MTDDLKGTPVLVHPELSYDPAGKQNQVGLISKANLMNDDVFVAFGDEVALYSTDALLVLLPPQEIHKQLFDLPYEMSQAAIEALVQVDLFLRYGDHRQHDALKIAGNNPAIRPFCLDTLQNQIIKNIDQNYSR